MFRYSLFGILKKNELLYYEHFWLSVKFRLGILALIDLF